MLTIKFPFKEDSIEGSLKKYSFKSKRFYSRKASCFLTASFIGTTFITQPVWGMDGESHWSDHDWNTLFYKPHHDVLLGPKILCHLDEYSLGRASRVNHSWRQAVDHAHHYRLDHEKQALYALILEVTGAEPNEVQRAHDKVKHYLETETKKGKEETDLLRELSALKPRFLQPESLIRANDSLLKNLLSANDLSESHAALKPIVALIKDLKAVLSLNGLEPSLEQVLNALKDHYETYLNQLLAPACNRALHLHPKVLLSGEAFLGTDKDRKGITSYRISQEMARSLLSKDEYGLLAKTNQQGSHAVCFKRSTYNSAHGVHFKGNTTNTGLAVGRESAVYALSQILFPQDMSQGSLTASALLTLNEVEINAPREGTEVNKAFRDALNLGKTSEEFFTLFPLYEKEFTEKSPHHVLQAGLHVEGLSLEDFIEEVDKGTYTYNQIDPTSFSEHIFISMLTNPTDGTPGNFMLRRQPGKSNKGNEANKNNKSKKGSQQDEIFSIVGIDNDMALEVGDTFVETIQSPFIPGQKITTQQKHAVRVKNILMCLPLMNRTLFPQVVERILTLNPELMCLQWLERLKQQNIRYDQLQQGHYTPSSLNQIEKPYLLEAQVSDLHLPFLLDPNFIPHVCQTIRQAQSYLADHRAATHWQLLLNIHPLSARFYQEMVSQSQNSVMKAYLKVDPPKPAPGKPRQEIPYLEDVLLLKETLLSGQTVGEALKDVTARSDGTQYFTQSLTEAAEHLLSTTDLFQQPFLAPFLRAALGGFEDLIQSKSAPQPGRKLKSLSTLESRSGPNPASQVGFTSVSKIVSRSTLTPPLHPSWSKDALLHKAIAERIPLEHLKKLLERGLDVTVMDMTRKTCLRHAIERTRDPEVLVSLLKLLRSFCPPDQLLSWINTVASDRLTALDIALEKKQLSAFTTLVEYGASVCHPNIALKFYRDLIKTTDNPDIKKRFLKLMTINDEIRWHVALEEMLPPYKSNANTGQQGISFSTAKFGKRLLPDVIKDQILGSKNHWKTYTQEGNHIVCRATHFNKTMNIEHSLYFKVYPELPGIEEAVGLLTRKLLNYGAPNTELINIGGCPVLVSHSHGDKKKTLDSILRDYPHLLKNLDEESLSGLILIAMLINPEDGKPSNYVMEPHPTNPKKYRIVGIDNDHAFVPAIVTEKPKKELFSKKLVPTAQVKTILYCLDQMKDPIHPNTQTLFINTRPDELFDEWLRELKKVNTSYSDLFPNREDHTRFFREHQSFLGVPFQKGAISHLYTKFVTLRDILIKSPGLSHMDLLSKLEARLAKRYQAASHFPSVKQRWDTVDAIFYEKTKSDSGTTLTRSGDILKSMDIPLQESILESIRLGKGLGPIQALEELDKSKEVLQIKTLEALGARVKDPHILKTLQNESRRAMFLDTLDFKILSPQEIEAILSYLKGKELRELTLKNCIPLNDIYLTQNLTSSALTKLNLRGCENITYRSLLHLSKTALTLEELNLPHITSLQEIGDIGAFRDAPLIFNNLRFLNVSHCINLSKILLQAPKLHYLNVENCALLNDQMLDGVVEHSPNLQKLIFGECPLLGKTNLTVSGPPYKTTYLKDVENITPILKILQSMGSELSFDRYEIDVSPQGLMAFERALKINDNLRNLTKLHSWGNSIGPEGAKGLGCGSLTALKGLNLWSNDIRDEGAKGLANGNLGALTSLNLELNSIGDEGAKGLAHGNLTALTSLDLENNHIGDGGVRELADGNFTALAALYLGWNNIGNEGAKGLAKGNLASLTLLHLGNNRIGDEGAKGLAQGNLTALTELDLPSNNIGPEGAKGLACGNLTGLTALGLEGNRIGDEGAKGLAKGALTALEVLDLQGNRIRSEGAKGLAKGNLTALTTLILWGNSIETEGARELAKGNLTALTSLHLGANNIGDEGAEELAKGNLTALTTLVLYGNSIGDEGVKWLAHGNLTALTSLSLGENKIGPEGAKGLGCGNLVSLTKLDLEANSIWPEGAKGLAQGNLTALRELYLKYNDIGDEGKKALNKRYPKATIEF